MKYKISQKMFAFGDDFSISNEKGEDVFYVDGRAFSFGKKLSLLDQHKKEQAFISQKLFAFTPTFEIKKEGRVVATLRKKMMTVRPQFLLDVAGPNDYHIVGDFFGHEYTVRINSKDVARVSKNFFSMTDCYGVDIYDGDPLMILCAVIVVDLVLHKKRKSPH